MSGNSSSTINNSSAASHRRRQGTMIALSSLKMRTITMVLLSSSCVIAFVIVMLSFNRRYGGGAKHYAGLQQLLVFDTEMTEMDTRRVSTHLRSHDDNGGGCYIRLVTPKETNAHPNSVMMDRNNNNNDALFATKHVAVCVPAKTSSTSFWNSVYWYENITSHVY